MGRPTMGHAWSAPRGLGTHRDGWLPKAAGIDSSITHTFPEEEAHAPLG